MSEKQVIVTLEDDFGRVQTKINTKLSPPQLMDELQSIINHIKCEENCEDYDYCCETVCSLYNEIKHLKEENEQLRKDKEQLKERLR